MKAQILKIYNKIDALKMRSSWNKGVQYYALYLLEKYDKYTDYEPKLPLTETTLLNGAKDWQQYSEGGCALIYDEQIALTLCNPTELNITKKGQRQPNKRETWLQVQARALLQAWNLIKNNIKNTLKSL